MVRSHHSLQQGKGASILEGVWAAHTSTLGPSVAERDHSRPGPQAVTLPSRWRGPSLTGVQDCRQAPPRLWKYRAGTGLLPLLPSLDLSPLPPPHLHVLKWVRGLTNGRHLVTYSGGGLLSLRSGQSHSSHRRKSCREIGPWGRAWVDQIPSRQCHGEVTAFLLPPPTLMPQTVSWCHRAMGHLPKSTDWGPREEGRDSGHLSQFPTG